MKWAAILGGWGCGRHLRLSVLACIVCLAPFQRALADFADATRVLQYSGSVFPLDAMSVPGSPNLLGVIDKLGRVDLLNLSTKTVYDYNSIPGQQPFLQLEVDPYPLFNDVGEQPRMYAHHGEAGLLGMTFHPSFATNGKFYLNFMVDNIVNPNGVSVPIFHPTLGTQMIDTSNGIDSTEISYVNSVVDPMDGKKFLEKCYVCEGGPGSLPQARLADLDGDTQVDDFEVHCPFVFPNNTTKPPIVINKQAYSEIREFTVNFNSSSDPQQWSVNGSSARTVMRFPRRRDFHNGGWIGFGPDGKLYVASGDSQGSPGEGFNSPAEPLSHPEDPAADFYGKILRIDVDANSNNTILPDGTAENYGIPSDNPFASGGAQVTVTPDDDEVFAYGLRNPWRASFDPAGNMWIGDVGFGSPQQGTVLGAEEVNLIPAGQWGGQNFGWPYYEGGPTGSAGDTGTVAPPASRITHLGADPNNVPPGIVEPKYFYFTSGTKRGSIIGGYVYDGPDESLQGQYIFYDSVRRKVWSLNPTNNMAADISHKVFRDGYDAANGYALPDGVADLYPNASGVPVPVIGIDLTSAGLAESYVGTFASFAEDANGNLYMVGISERNVFRLNYAGDFNRDLVINATDIDLLAVAAQLASPTANELTIYDLDGDGAIEFSVSAAGVNSDSDKLVRSILLTEYGDANLDRKVNALDTSLLVTHLGSPGTWASGDFNGSSTVNALDTSILVTYLGFSAPSSGLAGPKEFVPEPASSALASAALLLVGLCTAARHERKSTVAIPLPRSYAK